MRMMITFQFDPQDFAAIGSLLPQEQARAKELMDKGTMEALFISTDSLHVWLVLKGESQEHIEQELRTFPLHPYMKETQFVPLR